MIRIYICIIDGECQVERDLGLMAAELKEHGGLGDAKLANLMVMKTRGPATREHWRTDSHSGS